MDPNGLGESDTDPVDGQSDRDPDAVEDVEISPEENTSVPVPPGRVSLGGDMLRLTRAWKLFLLLPRMWLSRPPR